MNRRFKPGWLMILLVLTVVPAFVTLGLWQMERAELKEAIQQKFETRLTSGYQPFYAGDSLVDIEYRRLILKGKFDNTRSILVDNKLFEGRAGYEVLTPFILAGGSQVVLVNRGWVTLGDSRAVLPVIELPKVSAVVKGIASIPNTDGFRMGQVSLGESWPQVIPFIDIDAMQNSFSGQLLPLVLWLAPDQPGLYHRDWNPVWADPEKSRAYALQWFIFAAIAAGLFIVLNFRKVE